MTKEESDLRYEATHRENGVQRTVFEREAWLVTEVIKLRKELKAWHRSDVATGIRAVAVIKRLQGLEVSRAQDELDTAVGVAQDAVTKLRDIAWRFPQATDLARTQLEMERADKNILAAAIE